MPLVPWRGWTGLLSWGKQISGVKQRGGLWRAEALPRTCGGSAGEWRCWGRFTAAASRCGACGTSLRARAAMHAALRRPPCINSPEGAPTRDRSFACRVSPLACPQLVCNTRGHIDAPQRGIVFPLPARAADHYWTRCGRCGWVGAHGAGYCVGARTCPQGLQQVPTHPSCKRQSHRLNWRPTQTTAGPHCVDVISGSASTLSGGRAAVLRPVVAGWDVLKRPRLAKAPDLAAGGIRTSANGSNHNSPARQLGWGRDQVEASAGPRPAHTYEGTCAVADNRSGADPNLVIAPDTAVEADPCRVGARYGTSRTEMVNGQLPDPATRQGACPRNYANAPADVSQRLNPSLA